MANLRREGNITIIGSPFKSGDYFVGNVVEFLMSSKALNENPDAPIFIDAYDPKKALTFRQVKTAAGKLAYVLKNKYGIQDGDTVCLFVTNSISLPAVHYGILSLGAVVSPANMAYLPNELHHQLSAAKAKLIITQDELIDKAQAAMSAEFKPALEVENVVKLDVLMSECYAAAESIAPIKLAGDSAKTKHAYYCFSSGTSGLPKGVITSHYNISSNMIQQEISLVSLQSRLPKKQVNAAVLPMSHIYGLAKYVYYTPYSGVPTVVFPKFNFEDLLQGISKHEITNINIVPPMAVLFAKSPLVEKYPLVRKHLKYMTSGAAPLAKSLIGALHKRFDISIQQGYGLTESSPVSTVGTYDLDVYDSTSVGWLVPDHEARLVTEEGKDVEGFEERGELWLRGPNIMLGYLRNPAANAEVFSRHNDPNGAPWFRTGDVAYVDKTGQLFVVDRFKELIKSKGHQVAPAELENILQSHPEVADAAVTGIHLADEGTELPRAFVVLRNKGTSPLEIKAWFDGRVAKHKKLWGGIVVLKEVPKSPSGKILRRLLRGRTGDVVHGYRVTGEAKL